MRTVAVRRTLSALAALAVVASSVLVAAPATAAPGPDIVFTSPADGAALPPNQTVVVSGTVSDPSQSYTFSYDGGDAFALALTGSDFSYWVSTPNGWHTFAVSGGGSTSSVTFFLDNQGPDVVITSPAAGATLGDALSLDYTIGDGVASWISWDGAAETPAVGAPPYSFDVSGMTEGPHTVGVRAVDQYGNTTTATRGFTVDHTGPTVAVTTPVDGSWIDPAQSIAIMATSNDPGTQNWDLRVDGTPVAGGIGTTPIAYGMPAPTGWTNNSVHTITARSTDAVGNVGNLATATVRADTRKPEVTIAAPTATLGRSGTITGTASDAGSGVAQVAVDFRRQRPDDSCGAVQFSGTATLSGSTWSLALPGAAVSGDYCIRATATDAVGHTRVAAEQPHATVDVTGPVAPTGLAPVGEFWTAPTTLSWGAVPDAVSYNYRLAETSGELDGAVVSSTTGTSAAAVVGSSAWLWQVQGVDALGNAGAWTEPQQVTTLGAPRIDGGCSFLCGFVGSELDLSWSGVPGAVGYRVSVTWRGEPGDASDNIVERYLLGDATNATLTLPTDLPSGTIVVRVRAELDHKVEGTRLGPWSERVRMLHLAPPATPTLLSPADGAYVDGDGIRLAWTDDSSAFAWELRLSSVPTVDADGALAPEDGAPLLDPMILLLVAGGSGSVPARIDLDEIDAVLDCEVLGSYLGEGSIPVGCADGSFTLPTTLADGHYFWQVRGIGYDDIVGGIGGTGPMGGGAWSTVGHFIVGDAPVPVPPAAGGDPVRTTTSRTTTAGGTVTLTALPGETESEDEDPADDAPDATAGSGDADGSEGDAASEAPDPSGDGFPIGWLLAGIGALVVLAGAGALVRFLVVRGR